MGKIIVIVLVALVGTGTYWFYWEDDGANAPITVEYDLEVEARTRGANPSYWKVEGDLSIYARPNMIKIDGDIGFRKAGKKKGNIHGVVILRLDKKKVYFVLPEQKVYVEEEFKFAATSRLQKPGESEFDWDKLFKIERDGMWFGEEGEEDEQYFARKHTVIEEEEETTRELGQNRETTEGEMWFTNGTKLGRRHIKTLNKIIRIRPKEKDKSSDPFDWTNLWTEVRPSDDEKLPQLAKEDFPYFPLPLKVVVKDSKRDRNSLKTVSVKLNAGKISRKRISKSEFEPPSGCKKISLEKLVLKIIEQVPPEYFKKHGIPRRRN